MPDRLRRPAPFTPLSVTFATGKTGTAILEKFGLEGLAVWAAMLAAAKHEEGMIVFRHEDDWGAIGLAANPPDFTLKSFLTYLGRRKQTRTTRQGRVMYVELTQWEHWTQIKDRATSAWRKSRIRAQSKRDNSGTEPGHDWDSAGTSIASRAREDIDVDVEKEPSSQVRSEVPSVLRPDDDEEEGWESNGFDVPTLEDRPNVERSDEVERLSFGVEP